MVENNFRKLHADIPGLVCGIIAYTYSMGATLIWIYERMIETIAKPYALAKL